MHLHLVWLFILVSIDISEISFFTLNAVVDTIRVRIQTWPSSKPLPRSLDGLIGKPIMPRLYAGLPVALGFSVPALAVYLTTYDGKHLAHVTNVDSAVHSGKTGPLEMDNQG